MKGRPIIIEFRGEPRSLREIGTLIGVAPRTMSYRWNRGKRDALLFAPPDARRKRRGSWQHCAVAAASA